MRQSKKEHISVVMLGHVDCGKSTLAGHLAYKFGAVSNEQMHNYQRESLDIGKGSFKYAWVFSKLKAQRERGITINVSMKLVETARNWCTLIDVSGHRDFMSNSIKGIAEADVGLLVIAATPGEFEVGWSNQGQSRQHTILAYTFGCKKLIVAINKMDQYKENFKERRFNQVKEEVSQFVKKTGYSLDRVDFIPISAFYGYNLAQRTEGFQWYTGPTLVEAIESIEPPKRLTDKPFRFAIDDIFKIAGVGTVVSGKVFSGSIKTGSQIVLAPTGIKSSVKSMQMCHKQIKEASAGLFLGINPLMMSAKDVHVGNIIGSPSDSPPEAVHQFEARIMILNHPGQIVQGYAPVLHCHTAKAACKMTQLVLKLDMITGKVTEQKPQFLKQGDSAIVRMKPMKPLCLQVFNEYPSLGRFALRDMGLVIGVGIVKQIIKKGPL